MSDAPVAAKEPMAEANRLSTLLNASLGKDRFPVDVEQLARGYASQFRHDDPILDVIGDELPGLEGALYGVQKDGRTGWVLIYNSAIEVPGRIRFTMAHELGHYILHRRGRESFECSADDMLRWESEEKRIEAEADVFASYLLMPIDDFRRQIEREVVDLDVLGQCAQRYGVSLTAACLKWLEFTPQRAVLVMSVDGNILWSRASKTARQSGAFFRTRDRVVPIPEGSLAASDVTATMERRGVELAARTWFPSEPRDMTLREMKIVSDRYEQTMTLLVLPAAEPRDWPQDRVHGLGEIDDHIRSRRFAKR